VKVLTAGQMRVAEARMVQSGTSLDHLMAAAGQELAGAVLKHTEGLVVVLCGPGNNGGDGLIAASNLRESGRDVIVYSARGNDDAPAGLEVIRAGEDADGGRLRDVLTSAGAAIDALLGIGQNRPAEGPLARIVRSLDDFPRLTVVSADIPTGVDADSGRVLGPVVRADRTVAFGFLKVGNVVFPGAAYNGTVEVAQVGFAPDMARDARLDRPDDREIASILPSRAESADTNKGTFGRLLVIGGSSRFMGAPALVALAGLRTGAGLVDVAAIDEVRRSVAAHALEVTFSPLPGEAGSISAEALPALEPAVAGAEAVAIGPGLGSAEGAAEVVRGTMQYLAQPDRPPAIFDADALNILSRTPRWWENARPDMVLTPHPGEMARLTGMSVSEVQSDRLKIATECARDWGVVVVLKGAGTVVANPEGRASVNPTGGPNLATGGTGDVLSGIIGSLMAQGLPSWKAAVAGVYVHGRAGDMVRRRLGNAGTVAGDLIPVIPLAIKEIVEQGGR
jgi:hydroxyethylthiazole kinase-like uncharacterized protein yjeF